MKSKEEVLSSQKNWAERQEIDIDVDQYVISRDNNFFGELSGETLRDFADGDGSEIRDNPKIRTKIFATHSSSALACNFFEYWRFRDRKPLAAALGLNKQIKALVFEQKFSMGMSGNMPNLDLALILSDGTVVGIESKFTEWMSPHDSIFRESYFKNKKKRWRDVGLPACQDLAQSIHKGTVTFRHLNAPQLLKHALGIGNMTSASSRLIYLYFDLHRSSDIRKKHDEEISRFKNLVNGELQFKAITYQQLFSKLKKNTADSEHTNYFGYLENRYF